MTLKFDDVQDLTDMTVETFRRGTMTDRDRILEAARDSRRLLKKWLAQKHLQSTEYLKRITADWSTPTERKTDDERPQHRHR